MRGDRYFRGIPRTAAQRGPQQFRANIGRKADAVGYGPDTATAIRSEPCLPIHLACRLPHPLSHLPHVISSTLTSLPPPSHLPPTSLPPPSHLPLPDLPPRPPRLPPSIPSPTSYPSHLISLPPTSPYGVIPPLIPLPSPAPRRIPPSHFLPLYSLPLSPLQPIPAVLGQYLPPPPPYVLHVSIPTSPPPHLPVPTGCLFPYLPAFSQVSQPSLRM